MAREHDPRLSGLAAEEFELSNLEAELSARERAFQARARTLDDRRRVLAEREGSLRRRASELIAKAGQLGATVHAEVQLAADARALEAPLGEVARAERSESAKARRGALKKRQAAVEQAETAVANIESALREAEMVLAHREGSVAALAREVIRLEGELRARREAEAREIAERARRAEEARRGASALETARTLPNLPPIPQATPSAPPQTRGLDRRVHSRVRVDLDVTLSSEHNFFTGFAENLSEGGLFIATHEYLDVGTELDVTFRLPGGREIASRARVCWVREYNPDSVGVSPGMGVQFLDLRADDQAAVLAFLRQREPMFYA
jgi:uncharacterized protein (TIGR02266 family)